MKKRGCLILKSPVNPNLQGLVTLRDYPDGKIAPIVKLLMYYYIDDKQLKKSWLNLRDLYYLYFFLKKIIPLFEDYYAGDIDLEKLLDLNIDIEDEDFIK